MMSAEYQIRVKGQLDLKLAAWFGDFTITYTSDGDTLLTGAADQAALHGALARCRDLGLTLISINPLINRGDKLMNWIHAESSQVIDARPEEIHAIVRDYNVGHPAILPKEFFTKGLTVDKGGVGAGTVLHSSVTVMGREFPFRQIVSEPQLGRVIVETDLDTGQYTKFIFEPLNDGQQTRVTIASEFPPTPGLMGVMERFTKAPIVRKMFTKELQNLATYVANKAPTRA
jgi:hypothetical protein